MTAPATSDDAAVFSATRNVRLLYALNLAGGLMPFLSVWVVYLTDFRDINLAQVGLLETFFWAVVLIAEVPSGALADRFGRRLVFMLALITQGVGFLAFGFADSYPILLGSYVLWALGLALTSGNDSAYLYEALLAAGRESEFAAALGRLRGIGRGAAMVGAVLGGWIAAATTLQVPMLVTSALFFAALPIAFALQEPPRSRRHDSSFSYLGTLFEGARALRRDRAMGFMILFAISFSLTGGAGMLLVQPFLKSHDVPLAAFGLFLGTTQLLSLGGSLVAYRLPGIFGFARSLGLLFLIPAAGFLVLGAVDHVAAFAGFAVATLAFHMVGPLFSDYVNRRTQSDVRATILSVQPFGRSLVFVGLMPVAGWAAERSLTTTLGVLGAIFLVVAGASYVLWLRADRASRAAERYVEAAGD